VYIISLVNAGWDLANAKCAMICRAAALCEVYFSIVGTLPEGDLNIQFPRCTEPIAAFEVKEPVKEICSRKTCVTRVVLLSCHYFRTL
jgi:hypothetical protein